MSNVLVIKNSSIAGKSPLATDLIAVGVEGEEGFIPAQPETTVKNLIKDFNHSVGYKADERGYVSLYTSLMADIGGIEV